jgi:hypothetical protein
MTTNQRGGARPAVRPDDKRRNNPGGPGRMPKSFTLQLGQKLFVGAHDRDGNALDNEYAWTVTDVNRTTVTITSEHSGNTYRIHR